MTICFLCSQKKVSFRKQNHMQPPSITLNNQSSYPCLYINCWILFQKNPKFLKYNVFIPSIFIHAFSLKVFWHKFSSSRHEFDLNWSFYTFYLVGKKSRNCGNKIPRHMYLMLWKLKGSVRKKWKNIRWWLLLILLLSVVSIRRKLLKMTHTKERTGYIL